MTVQADVPGGREGRIDARNRLHEDALRSALQKRANRVPSLTIPEAAALCSVSREHLYRLVRAGAFPAVRMLGKYVIPSAVVEQLFDTATASTEPIDISEWAARWIARSGGEE